MIPGRPPTAPHGTVSAYKRHLRHGEDACAECKAANATKSRDYYSQRRLRAAVAALPEGSFPSFAFRVTNQEWREG